MISRGPELLRKCVIPANLSCESVQNGRGDSMRIFNVDIEMCEFCTNVRIGERLKFTQDLGLCVLRHFFEGRLCCQREFVASADKACSEQEKQLE